MVAFDTWESYFYPEAYDPTTGSGTLRNLFDERDADVLRVLEYGSTAQRQRELNADPRLVAHTFDAAHVRAIHGYLFGDVYEWAGEYRAVNISKGPGRAFGDVKTGEVDRLLDDMHQRIAGTDWGRLDRGPFGEQAATVFAYLNQAHPFREGNGRTGKVFMAHVAERSRFILDFDQVPPDVWNQASQLSRPDLFAYAPDPASLVPVFRAIARPRSSGPVALPESIPGRSAVHALYPQDPTQATNQPPQAGSRSDPRARRRGPHM